MLNRNKFIRLIDIIEIYRQSFKKVIAKDNINNNNNTS